MKIILLFNSGHFEVNKFNSANFSRKPLFGEINSQLILLGLFKCCANFLHVTLPVSPTIFWKLRRKQISYLSVHKSNSAEKQGHTILFLDEFTIIQPSTND